MKRIGLSLIFGAGFVFGYLLLLNLLYQIFQVSFSTLEILLKPINLPYEIYKMLFGFYYGDARFVKVANIIAGILMYSSIFYLILTLIAKFRKHERKESEISPEPPVFH